MSKKEKMEKMLAAYSTGKYTHEEIAIMFNTTYSLVCQFYNRHKYNHGLPELKRKLHKNMVPLLIENIEAAYKAYSEGSSLEEVGEKFGGGASRERVRQVFEKYSLKTRTNKKQK